ncbi:hypothetical protein D3C80_1275530 [compost metagenome]
MTLLASLETLGISQDFTTTKVADNVRLAVKEQDGLKKYCTELKPVTAVKKISICCGASKAKSKEIQSVR